LRPGMVMLKRFIKPNDQVCLCLHALFFFVISNQSCRPFGLI
jgi:hypothetical protein